RTRLRPIRQSPHRLGEEAQSTVAETTPQLTTRLRAGFFFALSGVTSLRSDRRNSVILWGLSILPLLNLVPIPCSNVSALPVLASETNTTILGQSQSRNWQEGLQARQRAGRS